MILKSEILTQASGSIGGVTYSHGRSGLQRQSRALHADKASNRQLSVRATFTSLTIGWSSELSETQRTAWRNYAATTPLTDRFGDTRTISGPAMFLRCNSIALQASRPRIDDAPTEPGLTPIGQVVITALRAADRFIVLTAGTSEWRENDGGACIIQTTQFLPQGATRNHLEKRRLVVVVGSSSSPPVVTIVMQNGFDQRPGSYPAGTPISCRAIAVDQNGRLSTFQEDLIRVVG